MKQEIMSPDTRDRDDKLKEMKSELVCQQEDIMEALEQLYYDIVGNIGPDKQLVILLTKYAGFRVERDLFEKSGGIL